MTPLETRARNALRSDAVTVVRFKRVSTWFVSAIRVRITPDLLVEEVTVGWWRGEDDCAYLTRRGKVYQPQWMREDNWRSRIQTMWEK
jgi:hypothetical protein